MSYWILIALGGALGAMSRHAVGRVAMSQSVSPLLGIFVVNISGSFIFGMLAGFLVSRADWPAEIRIFVSVGFLGSYTTFAALSVATVQSFEKGDISGGAINVFGSVSVGLAAAVAGLMLGRAI